MSKSSLLHLHRTRGFNLPGMGLLLAGALLSVGVYLALCAGNQHVGFPLDDAWIHQTYARNLARLGEWSFIPGQPSGGSTSPLWTLLLTPGYLLRLSPYVWTFLLGGMLLVALAWMLVCGIPSPGRAVRRCLPWMGMLLLFEWHFVWSAVSGMETLLHGLVILTVGLLLLRQSPPWLVLGLLTGLSLWARPDGITLLGPTLMTVVMGGNGWQGSVKASLFLLLGFALLAVPYGFFNFYLSGELLPTTFFAKQAEYAAWQASPLLSRLVESGVKFLTGPALLLLPGVLLRLRTAWKQREWSLLSLFVWMLGYLGLYAMRLPPYQHARYLIPAMPIYFLLALGGMWQFLSGSRAGAKRVNLLRFSWISALVIACAGFWWMGAVSYRNDVEFVETEMVAAARWVAANLPPEALVAAHDIGALGYFDDHPLVDLAGLVSPEVIPFLRNEEALAVYLDAREVTHLVTFPDWYPELRRDLPVVFTTAGSYAPSVGGTNMTVYVWQRP